MAMTDVEIAEMMETNKTLQEKLEKLEGGDDVRHQLSDLISDPNIRAVMDANEKGEVVRIRVGEEDVKAEEKGSKIVNDRDMDEMTNSEMFHHLSNTFGSKIATILDVKMIPIGSRLKDLDSKEENERADRLRGDLTNARSKYKDFDELKDTILELNTNDSSLSIDELYHLARLRTNKGPYIEPDPSSEKPTKSTIKYDGIKHMLKDDKGVPVKMTKNEIVDGIDDVKGLDKILEGLSD